MTSLPSAPASVRIDAWLWAIRAYKTRSAATAACRAGHVRLNGSPAKASATLVNGDSVTVRMPGYERILEVRRLINKRVGAEAASHCFTDHTPPRPVAPALGLPQRDRGAGRPTK
jgi:ribosome-associated heat shock protein Hsp15